MWPLDRLLRSLAAVCIIIVGTVAVAGFDHAAVRYPAVSVNARSCVFGQMMGMPEDAAVLLFGTSRVDRGLLPDVMSEELGDGEAVYNLGRPDGHMYRHVLMLRDLLERGVRPKVVVFELEIANFFAHGDQAVAHYPYAATLKWADIRQAADRWLLPRRLPLVSEGQIALSKLSDGIELTIGRAPFDALAAAGKPAAVRCVLRSFYKVTEGGERQKAEAYAAVMAAHPEWPNAWGNATPVWTTMPAISELETARAVEKLAGQYGFQLILFRMPPYAGLAPSAALRSQMAQEIPEFVFASDELYRLPPEDFMDAHHLSRSGAAKVSRWLASYVKQVESR